MKFTDLTIDQFQRIAAIEVTADNASKKVAVVAVMLNLTFDEAANMPISQVNKHYKQIEAELKELPEMKFKRDIKHEGKRYRLSLYTDTLSAGQLIELMSFNMVNEYEVIQNLHKIMATLARERKWLRTLKYNGAKHAERAEAFKSLSMAEVWGAVSFFLIASEDYIKIMMEYSGAKLKTMDKDSILPQSTGG